MISEKPETNNTKALKALTKKFNTEREELFPSYANFHAVTGVKGGTIKIYNRYQFLGEIHDINGSLIMMASGVTAVSEKAHTAIIEWNNPNLIPTLVSEINNMERLRKIQTGETQ